MRSRGRRRIRIVVIVCAAVLVLGAALAAVGLYETSIKKAAFGKNYNERPYDITLPRPQVSPTEVFTFRLDGSVNLKTRTVDGARRDKDNATYNDVAQVFSDPGLRNQIPAWIDQETGSGARNLIAVRPPVSGIQAFDYRKDPPEPESAQAASAKKSANSGTSEESTSTAVSLTTDNHWSGFKYYYLARYVDARGKKLKRPVVTVFTVKGEDFAIDAPSKVDLKLAAEGGINISWTPVSGATAYQVILAKGTAQGDEPFDPDGGMQFGLLAETTHTLVDTQDFDTGIQVALPKTTADTLMAASPAPPTEATQNTQFSHLYKTSEDDLERNRAFVLENGGINPYLMDLKDFDAAGNGRAAIAVVALKGDERSPLEFQDITALTARIPLCAATLANDKLKARYADQGQSNEQLLAAAATCAVTMADGHTALVPTVFEINEANTEWRGGAQFVSIPLCPQNSLTYITCGTVTIRQTPDWQAEVETASKQAAAKLKSAGAAASRFDYADTTDWSTFKVVPASKTMAAVPYPVNGSSDFVKFLASNLMAGNFYLDATAYLDDSKTPPVYDALEEAVAQNPYILYDNLAAQKLDYDGKHMLYITSFYQIKDWKSLQQQMWAKVQAVDAQIISPGMSDQDKAMAINRWLIRNATYDDAAFRASSNAQDNGTWDLPMAKAYYEAYPFTQNATGVLLKGVGVCASYAAGYKALADHAGLPCVYVTGALKSNGEGHAWDKVDLGGRWLIVDSAWCDESGSSLGYFGLTDNDPKADRSQDKSFMVDAFITNYAN